MIEEGLFSYLSTLPGLTALVGTRIYPNRLPVGVTMPAVMYRRIPEPGQVERSHSGSASLAHPRFQFDAWAETYTAARQVANQLQAALESYSGAMGDEEVQAVFLDNDFDDYDADALLHRVIQEYIVWHRS